VITNGVLSNRIGNSRARLAMEELKLQRQRELAQLVGNGISQASQGVVGAIGAWEQGKQREAVRAEEARRFDATHGLAKQREEREAGEAKARADEARAKAAALTAEQKRKANLAALEAMEGSLPMDRPAVMGPSPQQQLDEKRSARYAQSGADRDRVMAGQMDEDSQILGAFGRVESMLDDEDELNALAPEKRGAPTEIEPARPLTVDERGGMLAERAKKAGLGVTEDEARGVGGRRVLTAAEQRQKDLAKLEVKEARPNTLEEKDRAQTTKIGAETDLTKAKTVTEGERPAKVRAETDLARARADEARARAAKLRSSGAAQKAAEGVFRVKPGMKMPEALRKQLDAASVGIAEVEYFENEYKRLAQKYGGDLTGPLNAAWHRIQGKAGWDDPELSNFAAQVYRFKTEYGHEMFGSALTKTEVQNLLDSVPHPGDNDSAFGAKLSATKTQTIRRLGARIMSPANAQYFENPEAFGGSFVGNATGGPVQQQQLSATDARQRTIDAYLESLLAAGVPEQQALQMTRQAFPRQQ
jgi:hypothetical protein